MSEIDGRTLLLQFNIEHLRIEVSCSKCLREIPYDVTPVFLPIRKLFRHLIRVKTRFSVLLLKFIAKYVWQLASRIVPRIFLVFVVLQQSCGKVIFSVVSVILLTGVGGEGGTHCAGPQPQPQTSLRLLDIFKLIQVKPHSFGSTQACSNVFIMKHVWSASERLASYWNVFLLWIDIFTSHVDAWIA